MKKYRSHKTVEAGSIMGMSWEPGKGFVNVESPNDMGFERVSVPDEFYARGKPQLGDYLVRYESDGYLSWSPRDKFEAGYTEVPADYRGRVRAEREALAGNLDRLNAFIASDPRADDLMRNQAVAMASYLGVLDQRIARF